ncbi:Noc2p family protein [Colletotrichum graminicola]|uniref:Noc2p family protein n=1 Tax=Colletotrichum graminicola (strain M1.001 / M2 / FGSC 10212) TaxID=645133 RepID=E3Q4B5_COLGM|nr:Noc2p family protein [Colletotrichum graminicola M1.001]EFQ25427.1 Noc2p family protein [Colletotrichum graminicola M1.001]WDK11321.1 Noc2p family protein [Colletotrichum graminicola]
MGSQKKNLKATKKFEKNHLKGVLDKRKESAKIKQRIQVKAKKQTKKTKDSEFFKNDEAAAKAKANGHRKDAKVSAMSVDDFFQGGFEDIIEKKDKKASKKLGKRKRDAPVEEGSDSDSEDFSAEEQPVASDSEDAGSEDDDENLGMTKEAMEKLAENDPEFYKFLKENDPEALDFDENADLAEVDELSAGSDHSDDDKQPKKKRKKGSKKAAAVEEEVLDDNELTREMVAKWKKLIEEKQSLRAARQVVLAFRCAAHLNEDDADDEKTQRYTISNPEVFHDILIVALKQIPEVISHHLPIKESASGKIYVPTDSKKFHTLSMMIKTFTASIIHLLGTLSDDATLKLTIGSLEPLVPYLLSFRKLLKALIKTVVNYWARPASSETTKITSFLVLRKLVVIGDKGIRETVLKAVYQGLVSGCRATNINTIQGINLMKNSAAELWGIDQNVGYTTAFTFIRQLAIHLRNSIVKKEKDAHKIVYNWQYTHSLDFWSCVLAEHCSPLKEAETGKEGQLKLLIYPLVQVTLGAMRLIPSPTFFPLRFHLIRSILRLSRATNTYIPLASALIEVLESADMRRFPKASSIKPLDFKVAYKAPKSYLRTRVYQDGVGEQVVELLSEYFTIWAKNIAFPEFALPVLIQLKRWLKQARKTSTGNKNNKVISQIVLLVQKLEANAKFIEEKRAKVEFAPKDRAQVDAFLRDFDWEKTPLGAFVVVQRKIRDQKAKALEEARKEDEKKRKEEEKDALAANVEDDSEEEYADELMDDEADEVEEEDDDEDEEDMEDDEE